MLTLDSVHALMRSQFGAMAKHANEEVGAVFAMFIILCNKLGGEALRLRLLPVTGD